MASPLLPLLALALCWCCVACLRPPDADPIDPGVCAEPAERFDGVLVAGSGATTPVVRALLAAAADPARPIRVAESIGSTGALAALGDGAIDVGLLSRDPRPTEQSTDVVVAPFAASAVVWGAHPDVTVRSVDAAFLADVYAGRRTQWPDGLPAVPIVREQGDSGLEVLRVTYPDVVAAVEDARRARRGLLATTDDEARALLEQVPGAVGPSDLGMLRVVESPVRVLTVGGLPPERLPLRALSLVWPASRSAELAPLLRPIVGPEADGFLLDHGYVRPH